MTPIPFSESNRVLQAPAGAADIASLPVWTDDQQCVSCWRLTWRERLSALLFGRVWLAVLSGRSQPPVALLVTRRFFGGGEA